MSFFMAGPYAKDMILSGLPLPLHVGRDQWPRLCGWRSALQECSLEGPLVEGEINRRAVVSCYTSVKYSHPQKASLIIENSDIWPSRATSERYKCSPLIFPPAILSHPEFNGFTHITFPRARLSDISKGRKVTDRKTCSFSAGLNFEI